MKKENIHERAARVAASYLSSEVELISILQSLDRSKAFAEVGYSSLRHYCVGHMRLSEDRAEDLVRVARKSYEVPELKAALEAGKITLSNARMIIPILNKENGGEWLTKASASKRDLQQEIKRVFPELPRVESLRFVGGDRLDLRFEISSEEEKLLQRAVDVLSQKENKLVSRKDVLMRALGDFLERQDPVRRAERVLKKRAQLKEKIRVENGHSHSHSQGKIPSKSLKTPGPARVKPVKVQSAAQVGLEKVPSASQVIHAVNLRDRGRCTHITKRGERCTNTKFIDTHHIMPREFGGKDTLNNLTTLCRLHHRVLHREV